MKNYKEINQDQRALNTAYMKDSAGAETMNAMMGMHKAAMAGGTVPAKTKELIALGIAIANRCDGCIGAHVAAAIKQGVSRTEIIETINVAVMMGGGPSLTYGTQALGAFDELSK